MSIERPIDDVEFLRQGKWPNWPFCPVKRYEKGELQCGLVYDNMDDGVVPMVLMINLFALSITEEVYDGLEKHKYDSIELLVADGWMVD